jgi:hypothetical protein
MKKVHSWNKITNEDFSSTNMKTLPHVKLPYLVICDLVVLTLIFQYLIGFIPILSNSSFLKKPSVLVLTFKKKIG